MLGQTPLAIEAVSARLASWYDRDAQTPRLEELTERLRRLRAELLARVFGQDHAVHAFVEGLFNAEVVAAADTQRQGAAGAVRLRRPAGRGQDVPGRIGGVLPGPAVQAIRHERLRGTSRTRRWSAWPRATTRAHPGTLTEFVEKNPNAVLLFDEIEKAHLNTIHLFLQILDAGTLEDKYPRAERRLPRHDDHLHHQRRPQALRPAQRERRPRGQRRLPPQDHPRRAGEREGPSHGRAVLPAGDLLAHGHRLSGAVQPPAGQRTGAGGSGRAEPRGGLLQVQYYKRVAFDELLPMCLVLREGARADARTLRSQAETFVKTETLQVLPALQDRSAGRSVLSRSTRSVSRWTGSCPTTRAEVAALFEPQERPRVLFIADTDLTDLYRETIPEVDWQVANTAEDALEVLADQEVDLVLARPVDRPVVKPARA